LKYPHGLSELWSKGGLFKEMFIVWLLYRAFVDPLQFLGSQRKSAT